MSGDDAVTDVVVGNNDEVSTDDDGGIELVVLTTDFGVVLGVEFGTDGPGDVDVGTVDEGRNEVVIDDDLGGEDDEVAKGDDGTDELVSGDDAVLGGGDEDVGVGDDNDDNIDDLVVDADEVGSFGEIDELVSGGDVLVTVVSGDGDVVIDDTDEVAKEGLVTCDNVGEVCGVELGTGDPEVTDVLTLMDDDSSDGLVCVDDDVGHVGVVAENEVMDELVGDDDVLVLEALVGGDKDGVGHVGVVERDEIMDDVVSNDDDLIDELVC